MLKTVEEINSTKKRLNIEIPSEVIEKEYSASINNVRQRARIPGFRQGKAPMSLLEKRFGDDIKADIIDRLVPDYYSKAVKEANLIPVAFPKIEGMLDIKRNEPLNFTLTVEVRPEIGEVKYDGLKVKDIPADATDQDVEDALKGILNSRAEYDVVEREVGKDDLLVIDYIKTDSTGEKELSNGKDQVMNLGANTTPQGILDQLVGRKKGDVVDIVLPTFEGGEVKEEGKGDKIRLTIKEVKEKRLPVLDDDFAKDIGHENLAELKTRLREGISASKKNEASSRQKASLIETLLSSYNFDIPEILLEKEVELLVMNEGIPEKKQPEAGSEGIEEKDAFAEAADRLRPKAVNNVKASLLLDLIAEKEGVTVSEDELKSKISALAAHLKATPENVVNLFMTRDGSLERLKRSVRDEKVMDIVLSKAEIVKGA